MSKVIAVSGYFDPIHIGHLEYLRLAKDLGDKLIVIVNNNHQCVLKKGDFFMDEADRVEIVKALGFVDEVFLSIDTDKTVCASLAEIKPDIFANGGDRHNEEIPESVVGAKYGIKIIDGLGEKIRSSSELTGLKEMEEDESIRPWGHYEVLLDTDYCKVKRIYVKPKQRLSYHEGETVLIALGDKHRMANPSTSEDMILVEVQTGTYFGEDDIIRIEDDYERK
jgi:cytidyltransferase-like protein